MVFIDPGLAVAAEREARRRKLAAREAREATRIEHLEEVEVSHKLVVEAVAAVREERLDVRATRAHDTEQILAEMAEEEAVLRRRTSADALWTLCSEVQEERATGIEV
eukprot:SAG11_NODE_21751_length_419_cov_1.115625_1_plen_107_part_01